MVLYFLMQLPYIQKIFIRNFPSLFNRDGFHTLSGYLVQTSLFGIMFYGLKFAVKSFKCVVMKQHVRGNHQ